MGRGQLTEQVIDLLKEKGFEGTKTELRLFPYLISLAMDNSNLDRRKVTAEEKELLKTWEDKEWIKEPFQDFQLSTEFFDKIVEVVKLGYVSEVLYENSIS